MTIKVPYGYERQPILRFLEISKGERPAIEEQTASWLPVVQLSTLQTEWWVILAGTILTRDDATNNLVPCPGPATINVPYTVNDVNYTYDVVNPTTLVTVAMTRNNQLTNNPPIGWAPYHFFARSMQTRRTNYDLQPNVATLNDYIIQMPLVWDEQTTGANTLINGCLIRPQGSNATWLKNGSPVRWLNGVDSVEYIAGRALIVENIAVYDNLDKVRVVRGSGLSGDGTGGIETWLSANHEDGDPATISAKIAIDLM